MNGLREAGLVTYPPLGRRLGRLFGWLVGRLQGPSPPHRIRARPSAALAEVLAGPTLTYQTLSTLAFQVNFIKPCWETTFILSHFTRPKTS